MVLALALTFSLAAFGLGFAGVETTAQAQQHRTNNRQMRNLAKRLETHADRFSRSLDAALDRSTLDGTAREDETNALVDEFEYATDRLRDRAEDDVATARDVEEVLGRALRLEMFMRANNLKPRAQSDWARVKADLDELAYMQNVAWVWTGVPVTTIAVLAGNAGARANGEGDQNPRGEAVGMTGNSATRSVTELAREVRRELLTELPYYGVFDWIEYEVRPDRTVVLRGHVTTPPDTKSRAESVVSEVEGVRAVVNEIEVLPVSPNDDRLRRALYRAIYDFDSPLFKYGVGSRQAIHIVVRNGRVTLEGVVESSADRQLAYTRARAVPGTFAVDNHLRVDAGRRY